MRLDTALTALSMTSLFLIVGLIFLTANEMGITGNFYAGIPTTGEVSRDKVPLSMVSANPAYGLCYQEGIEKCKRLNAGENFIKCANGVALQCGTPQTLLSKCYLPAGFELKYTSNRECEYAVVDECSARCPSTADTCVMLSKGRCGLIGGRFQSQYLQSKYVSYGLSQ